MYFCVNEDNLPDQWKKAVLNFDQGELKMLNLGIYTIYWLSPLRTPRLRSRKNRQHRHAQPRETLALRQ